MHGAGGSAAWQHRVPGARVQARPSSRERKRKSESKGQRARAHHPEGEQVEVVVGGQVLHGGTRADVEHAVRVGVGRNLVRQRAVGVRQVRGGGGDGGVGGGVVHLRLAGGVDAVHGQACGRGRGRAGQGGRCVSCMAEATGQGQQQAAQRSTAAAAWMRGSAGARLCSACTHSSSRRGTRRSSCRRWSRRGCRCCRRCRRGAACARGGPCPA